MDYISPVATRPFKILRPQNPSFSEFNSIQKIKSTDLDDQKLRNDRSGRPFYGKLRAYDCHNNKVGNGLEMCWKICESLLCVRVSKYV